MPGNAGDAPEFVQLVDKKGNVLNEADVDMVQSVYVPDIFWEKICKYKACRGLEPTVI